MQTGAEHLIKIDERLHRLFLADDLFSQRLLEVASCRTTLFRVQNSREPVICTVFQVRTDRKSTRLNSSHQIISYAVFCLKKKNNHQRLGCSIPIRSLQLAQHAILEEELLVV